VTAAGQLRDPLGQELLEVARQAVIQGLHLAAAVSAAVAVGAAILAVVLLRGVRPSVESDEQLNVGKRRGECPESIQVYAR